MHFYTIEEKELIGRYCKYYRKINNIKIYDLVNNNICDYKTYRTIENGKLIKSEEIYDKLCNYYHINIDVISFFLMEIKEIIKKIYISIEFYELKEIKHNIDRIMNLSKNNDEEFINEFLYVINLIQKFYLNNEYLTENEIIYSLNLIGIWNGYVDAILIEMCEKSNWNSLLKNSIFVEIRKYLNDRTSISQYWLAMDYILQSMYSNALDIFNLLKIKYNSENNQLRELEVMMRMFHIYRDIDDLKASKMAIEIENILNSNKALPDSLVNSSYYSLGMYYYLNKKYSLAMNYFKKSFEISNNAKSLLFIYACGSRINDLIKLDNNILESHALYNYIHYFELKEEDLEPSRLEDYILNDLMKNLKNEKNEEPLWSMFRYEMEELVRITKRYKNYYKFQEKFHISTQNCE